MKKFAILSMSLLLCACSTSESVKSKKEVCKGVQNSITLKNEFQYTGDRVDSLVFFSNTNIAELSIDKDEIKKRAEETKRTYNNVSIDYVYEVQEKSLTETVTVDMKKVSVNDLTKVGLLPPSYAEEKELNVDDIREYQEMLGLTCD